MQDYVWFRAPKRSLGMCRNRVWNCISAIADMSITLTKWDGKLHQPTSWPRIWGQYSFWNSSEIYILGRLVFLSQSIVNTTGIQLVHHQHWYTYCAADHNVPYGLCTGARFLICNTSKIILTLILHATGYHIKRYIPMCHWWHLPQLRVLVGI